MNWKAVADSLFDQAEAAVASVEVLRKDYPDPPDLGRATPELINRMRIIERHRINANFCYAMAAALDAGLGIKRK